ncbi:polyprenyl synthetase family protein, partial [Nocardia sp. NPDC003482]
MSAGTSTRPASTDKSALIAAVQQTLVEFFDSRHEFVDELGPVFVTAADSLRDFVLRGGKRTRPAFAWTGWLGAGGDPTG